MVAHVLPSNVVPLQLQWLAISMTVIGGFGVVRIRRRFVELSSWGLFTTGALGCVTMVGIAMLQPTQPPYSLSLALARSSGSPVYVTVCGSANDGSPATVPDGDRLLAIFVDGNQVDTGPGSRFAVTMTAGMHSVRAELITRDHREFNPLVAAEATTNVGAATDVADSTWVTCPSG